MKNIFFGLIATIFMGITVNAQVAVPGFQTVKTQMRLISTYAGPCESGPGFCSGLTTNPTSPTQAYTGIAKATSTGKVTLVFNEQFLRENNAELSGGAIVIGRDFPLNKEVSEAIGISGVFTIRAGSYRYTLNNGYYYCAFN